MFELNRPIVPVGSGVYLQIVMNIIPLLGVIFWDWSVFALIYSFWLETLAFSFFNAIKIAFAKESIGSLPLLRPAFSYLLVRVLVLLFYMLFILVFIGIMVAGKQEGAHAFNYLLFLDKSFKYTMLTFFIVKSIELVYQYFYLGERKTTSAETFKGFFDSRIIVIHVVIVLGVFAFQFFSEKFDNHTGIVAFACVFVLVKTLAEMVAGWVSRNN